MNTKTINEPIVITGMGVVTSLGRTVPDFWDGLRSGRSGVTKWKSVDSRIYSKIGGDLTDFNLTNHLSTINTTCPESILNKAKKQAWSTPLSGQLTLAAALEACVMAGWTPQVNESAMNRAGHVLAGHNLNPRYIHENICTLHDEPDFIDALFGMKFLDTDVLALICEQFGLRGISLTVGGACASGNVALLTALDMLRYGRADLLLVTGGAVGLDETVLQGWSLIDAVSYLSFNDQPEKASRPFDARREGFVPSIGSAAVVLERLSHARQRQASPLAILAGAAASSDASRQTKPNLSNQAGTMQLALDDAGIPAERIDYVNAHATSTPLGDINEIAALKQVFGPRAFQIPVNATKSMTGHCLTASAIVELVATILQMQHGLVHPTINQEVPDPDCNLDCVPNQARPHAIRHAMSNAFGFGGLNACVVVSSFEEDLVT